MIALINAAATFVGPIFWVLMPLSIIVMASLMFIVASQVGICAPPPAPLEIFLDWAKDGAVMIGLTGNLIVLSSLAESGGFESVELASRKIFALLSTGFRGSVIGVVVSIVADICLRILKRGAGTNGS